MDSPFALIIDDNPDINQFFNTVLQMEGFTCQSAGSAKQALYRLAVSAPDLVLLDLRLRSEIGGDDILYQIRSNPRLDHTHVIIVTAYPEMAEPVKHLADLVLYKPVAVDQLRGLASRLVPAGESGAPRCFRDPVTDLYNRSFYLSRLEQAVERARRRSEFLFATLYFTFGAAEPEEPELDPDERRQALRQVAERLRRSYRPTDTLALWNSDQFATLHEELREPENVNVLVGRLEAEMQAPCEVSGRRRRLRPRFHAVLHNRLYPEADALLQAARRSWLDVGGASPG